MVRATWRCASAGRLEAAHVALKHPTSARVDTDDFSLIVLVDFHNSILSKLCFDNPKKGR